MICTFSMCLLLVATHAQTSDIASILLEVAKNNQELQAYSSWIESQKLDLKSNNNLPDPQIGGYYLPIGNHNTGNYTEFQVTQSFEFPSVYKHRAAFNHSQQGKMALAYSIKRQAILLKAKKHCLELIFLNKKRAVEQLRVAQAEKIFKQVKMLFEKEEVGILEFNKAKIAWLQEQFNASKIDAAQDNLLLQLKQLNGGNSIILDQANFTEGLSLDSLSSIWKTQQTLDPMIQQLAQEEKVALQKIQLSKSKTLPNLTLGLNYQGVANATYAGIYGGISVPLWSNKHKVAAAEAKYQHQQSFSNDQSLVMFTTLKRQYNTYQILLNKFQVYQNTLNGLNSNNLLLKAYELGEISFMEYYTELQFNRQAYDAVLEMENQLYQLKADILKHQL